ncbi:hypothetical protein HY479_02225 [Candidatus Uhrbacteria bacterium]|nr:hypothetical protein [Candidatus Uhrbacteria bacterium]
MAVLSLRSSRIGNLCLEDVKNIERQFPALTPDGDQCWAVAGGGATKFLLEARKAVGYDFQDETVEDVRRHKDLDISVFRPEMSKLRIEHPHEIFRAEFWKTPKRCNYRKENPNYTGFFIEMLTDWYFGFPPPILEETVKVYLPEAVVYTLVPEYIIASRLFDISPPREGIDDEDSRRLQAKFFLNEERIVRAAQRSVFGFMPESLLVEFIREKKEDLISQTIIAEVCNRFPMVYEALPVTSHIARCLLLFRPDDLRNQRFTQAIRLADELLDGKPSWKNSSALYTMLIMLVYGQSYGLSQAIKKSVGSLMEIYAGHAHHRYLGQVAHLCKGLIDLEGELIALRMGYLYKELAERTLSAFCKTAFRNVLSAGLDGTNKKLKALREPLDAWKVLATFTNLIGWRSWTKHNGVTP